jgi:hypothetical protein
MNTASWEDTPCRSLPNPIQYAHMQSHATVVAYNLQVAMCVRWRYISCTGQEPRITLALVQTRP